MTQDELMKIIQENTQGPRYWPDIITAVETYSSASNNGKPRVSGALLPPDKIWLLKEIAGSYIYETAEEGTYSIATQGIEKILESYELLRQQ